MGTTIQGMQHPYPVVTELSWSRSRWGSHKHEPFSLTTERAGGGEVGTSPPLSSLCSTQSLAQVLFVVQATADPPLRETGAYRGWHTPPSFTLHFGKSRCFGRWLSYCIGA